jgi:hypothetical protein
MKNNTYCSYTCHTLLVYYTPKRRCMLSSERNDQAYTLPSTRGANQVLKKNCCWLICCSFNVSIDIWMTVENQQAVYLLLHSVHQTRLQDTFP